MSIDTKNDTHANTQIVAKSDGTLANAEPDRLTIRKDLAQFEARIASYPEEVRDDVVFLYQFNQTQFSGHYSLLADFVRKEGKFQQSDQYFYQVLGGKYFRRDPNNPAKFSGSVAKLKEIIEWIRRWSIFNSDTGGMPFVETPTWVDFSEYIDGIRAPENPCKFGAVNGPTGRGKSRMLKRWQILHNHGNTAHVEAPSGGRLPRFQMKLGAQFGIGITAETHERLVRLTECVNAKRTIIVDNVWKLYDPKRGAKQDILNYLQELQDDTGCTIILSWTPVFQETLSAKENEKYFEQFIGRLGGLDSIFTIDPYMPEADLDAIREKYRIAGGKKATVIMSRWSREPGRDRILFRRLYLSKLFAREQSRANEIRLSDLEAIDGTDLDAADKMGGAS